MIILDVMMPDKDGWQALQIIKAKPEISDIPVVIMSVMDEKELAFSLGAVDYFIKPIDRQRFKKRIAELSLDDTGKVLLVDDNPADVRLMASILESANISTLSTYSGKEGIQAAKDNQPSMIVLDIMMPDMNGFEVINRLRADKRTRDIPIVILTMKELTKEEFATLRQHTKSILKKATFNRKDLLSEIKKVTAPNKVTVPNKE